MKNGKGTIGKDQYLKAAQVFHWATREHYAEWFTGEPGRHRRTEVMLPRLVRKGKLRVARYGRWIVYSAPRRARGENYNIPHGLACTEGLVRFWRSDMTAEIIPERAFRGGGVIPEWGLRFSNGNLLLYEFCTEDNFQRYGLVKGKMNRYQKIYPEAFVLFVIDTEREKVEKFVSKITGDNFFFTDYETFKSVPIGQQLIAPIYFWCDGRVHPLRHGLEPD
jgi:hypothetical protein